MLVVYRGHRHFAILIFADLHRTIGEPMHRYGVGFVESARIKKEEGRLRRLVDPFGAGPVELPRYAPPQWREIVFML